jgi:peptidyl-prolyl cis-trans isomerase D
MFGTLRKAIIPIMGTVLVVFVLTIFWNWGYGGGDSPSGTQALSAGSVNGTEISWRDYQTVYNNLYQAETQKQDADVSDVRVRELEQQAWDQLVAEMLINQEADKRHVVVTDDDVYTYLKLSPPQMLQQAQAFQTDGKFDYNKYLSSMADDQMAPTWAQIEEMMRPQLRQLKLRDLILQTVQVSEPEVKEAFLESQEKVKVAAVNVRTKLFETKVAATTQDEARAYFNEHRDDYKENERVVLSLIKVPVVASAADSAAALQTARMVYDSAMAGVDFATLAQTWSEDPGTAGKGGDVGLIEKGRLAAEFDSAAFAMKEGEISTPVKTRFGWHIIKHNGYVTEEAGPTSSQKGMVQKARVSHILISVQISPTTKEAAYGKLTDLLAEVGGDGAKLTSAAAGMGLQTVTTQPVTRDQRIMEAGGDTRVNEWAFGRSVGDISDVLEVRDAYLVARLDQKLPAGLAEFETVEKKVTDLLHKEKLAGMCRDTSAVIYGRVQGGLPLKQAAELFGAEYEEIGPFSRATRLMQLDRDPLVVGAAFSLKNVGEIGKPVDYTGGAVIMQLMERLSPDLSTFNQKRDSVSTAVLNQRRQQAYNKWYTNLLAAAKIQSNVGWSASSQSQ